MKTTKTHLALTFALLLATLPTVAQANSGTINYTPGALKAAIAKGQTVLVDYKATW